MISSSVRARARADLARLWQDSKPSCQRRIDCLCRVIGATALPGLWRIQFQALSKYLGGARTPEQVHRAVAADVRSAAQLIDTGLNSFAPLARDGHPATANATQHAPRRTLSRPPPAHRGAGVDRGQPRLVISGPTTWSGGDGAHTRSTPASTTSTSCSKNCSDRASIAPRRCGGVTRA